MQEFKKVTYYQTTNYDLFHVTKKNRIVSPAHIRRLVKSYSRFDGMPDIPIIVDKDFNILDGQNRKEARQALKKPIIFKFADVITSDNIPHIQIGKGWNANDFLEKYCSEGNENYIKFRDFMRDNKITKITVAQKIIGKLKNYKEYSNGHPASSGYDIAIFNDGLFQYPEDDQYARDTISMLKDLALVSRHNDPYNRSIIVALDLLVSNKNYDHSRMREQILKYSTPTGYADAVDLVKRLEYLYNRNYRDDNRLVFKTSR